MSESIVGAPELRLGHLYPDQLNVYGDRGNIIVLQQRCAWRGIQLRISRLEMADALDPTAYDMLFIGGGQDREQDEVARDMREVKGESLWAAVEGDMPFLAVCGGYQLLAKFYRPAEGPELEGIGIFDAWTIHKGKRVARCIGNVALGWGNTTLVGFENHGGRTYLGPAPCRWVGCSTVTVTIARITRKAASTAIHTAPTCTARSYRRIRIWPTTSWAWRWIAAMAQAPLLSC